MHLLADLQLIGRQRHLHVVGDGFNGAQRLAQLVDEFPERFTGPRIDRGCLVIDTGFNDCGRCSGHRFQEFPFPTLSVIPVGRSMKLRGAEILYRQSVARVKEKESKFSALTKCMVCNVTWATLQRPIHRDRQCRAVLAALIS